MYNKHKKGITLGRKSIIRPNGPQKSWKQIKTIYV